MVTVEALLDTLELPLLAGRGGGQRTVRWAHISELEDPTPWLRGGELLLTVGMGIPEQAFARRRYFERLVKCDLAGLGLGVGFRFSSVPAEFLAAADRAGFPLFEVPFDMPFIAITEALAQAAARDEHEHLERTIASQDQLSQIALRGGGVGELIAVLARAIKGWAVVLNRAGQVVSASSSEAAERVDAVRARLPRMKASGGQLNVSYLDDHGYTRVLAVMGPHGTPYAYLAFGKAGHLERFDRLVAGHAFGLLSAEVAKQNAIEETERRLQRGLLEALATDTIAQEDATDRLLRHGFGPGEQVVAYAVSSHRQGSALAALERALDVLQLVFISASVEGELVALAGAENAPTAAQVQKEIAGTVEDVRVGRGRVRLLGDAARTVREARLALRICQVDQQVAAESDGIGWSHLVLAGSDNGALSSFVQAVLAPIEAYESEHGGDLLTSLELFLDHNGKWDAAARALHVHRHTLRNRMEKVEQLTGRDLARAKDRTELWLALRARGLQSRCDASA